MIPTNFSDKLLLQLEYKITDIYQLIFPVLQCERQYVALF